MDERTPKQEKTPIALESIYSPEETAQLYEHYRAIAGDKLMGSLIESNNILTISGVRIQTEFFFDNPDDDSKSKIERLNERASETGVYFDYRQEFDASDGKRTAHVEVFNLKALEKLTAQPPIPELPRYNIETGMRGFYDWSRAAGKVIDERVTQGNFRQTVDILSGLRRGYPWVVCLDNAHFPSGYENQKKDELGIERVRIPHAHMYGGRLPEFDVKKEHTSHPDVVKAQQQREEFLKQFYNTTWHKELRTRPEFLLERGKKREEYAGRFQISSRERVGPLTETILRTMERVSTAQRKFIDRIKSRLGLIHSVGWAAQGFDVADAFKKLRGQIVEVGGPTLDGFKIVHQKILADSGKQYITTNINDGLYQMAGGTSEKVVKIKNVDVVADSRQLPFADGSLGAVFASCLPLGIRAETMLEARRVLEDDGLLVWQGTMKDDYEVAQRIGLELLAYEWEIPSRVQNALPQNLDLKDVYAVSEAVKNAAVQTQVADQVGDYDHQYAPRSAIFRKRPLADIPAYPGAGLYDYKDWIRVTPERQRS